MKTTESNVTTHQSSDGEGAKMITKVGKTTYEVNIHFSKTSKETFTDKVLRLIRNDVKYKR